MARIAYILLTHRQPEAVVAQANRLTAAGDRVVIHHDARAPRAEFNRLQEALAGNEGVVFARRVRCGWGEWSLVQATLNGIRAALRSFPDATHLYLLSGDCMPIKSACHIHDRLDQQECDHIESVDFFTSGWIRTGLVRERLVYRHFFNERRRRRLFYASLALQQRLGLERRLPDGLDIMIGSQWWCLRRTTVEAILELCRQRPDVLRFFRTSWIPDETFFQTLVRAVVPANEISSAPPTFLIFTDYGYPAVFCNDHHDFLVGQREFFARKISPDARELRQRLGDLYLSERKDFPSAGDGRKIFSFVVGQGRIGRRFAPRFWERESTIGRDRTLHLLACKKWHVAKRLLERIRERAGIPGYGYLFNEQEAGLPDLGGIERTVEKRNRHRRALVRLLFEHSETDRLVLCVDPADIEVVRDFATDRCETRVLSIHCRFSDDYLIGHARRIGLVSHETPRALCEELLPTLRETIRHEREQLRGLDLAHHHRLDEEATRERNAAALAAGLDISPGIAEEILDVPHLFDD